MNVPSNLRYTENDEWLKLEGNSGTIGITDFAQNQLSDIVYVEVVVSPGDKINKGDTIATVESVKAAADIYAPASGKVIALNEALGGTPEVIVDGVTGRLVSQGDDDALVHAICELLAPEGPGKAMGIAARERLETSSTFPIFRTELAHYLECLGSDAMEQAAVG